MLDPAFSGVQRISQLVFTVRVTVRLCSAPIYQIVENGGVVISEGQGNFGNDAHVDMVKAGIIDPTKLTRSALQNAASVAHLRRLQG